MFLIEIAASVGGISDRHPGTLARSFCAGIAPRQAAAGRL